MKRDNFKQELIKNISTPKYLTMWGNDVKFYIGYFNATRNTDFTLEEIEKLLVLL
jgi:hypothetical protein